MRIIGAGSVVYLLAVVLAITASAASSDNQSDRHQPDGQNTFRYDTFGDEQLWTDVLRMQDAVSQVSPATALAVGLKVDVDALPTAVVDALRAGAVDLNDPAVTRTLLRLNAVVGVKGTVNDVGQLTRIGVTCALCHSSVDNSFAPGIGKRLDGWANRDLNVGAIVALSPVLDEATKADFRSWGPGRYDPRHHAFDGTNILSLNRATVPVLIPPIYGLKGVGFETYTADGPISYWNSYVGVTQMGGHGSFSDPRINLSTTQTPDQVTPTLPDLLDYQLSLKAPRPAAASYNHDAAERGEELFRGQARCSTCHRGSTFTDVLDGPDRRVPLLHSAAEVGVEPVYAARSATGAYRTTPLRALQSHAPYFHDGSARDLVAVVDHYDRLFHLALSAAEKADLVEYLKSL